MADATSVRCVFRWKNSLQFLCRDELSWETQKFVAMKIIDEIELEIWQKNYSI